jgi:hypothetical protein
MILARQNVGSSCILLNQRKCPMPTDIMMGPDLALSVFDQEKGKASLGVT